MSERRPLALSGGALLGLGFILFGALHMAANLGWLSSNEIWLVWPLLVIVWGLARIAMGNTSAGRGAGVLAVLFGSWWLAGQYLDPRFHIFKFWPVLVIAAGAVLLFRGPSRADSPGVTGNPSPSLSAFAFWSGAKRRAAGPFQHGDVVAVMGGAEVDLRQATVTGPEATLDLTVLMGGVVIRVPPDWTVLDQTFTLMGGTEDKTDGAPDGRNRLVLRGFVVMGGIEIKS